MEATTQPNLPLPASIRLPGVDLAKNLAAFLVVVIHSEVWIITNSPPANNSSISQWAVVIARGAVPLFFLLSGWLFARRRAIAGKTGWECVLRRLLGIYVVWCVFYAFLPGVLQAARHGTPASLIHYPIALLADLGQNPIRAFFSGTAYHLWFLPNLAAGLAALALTLRFQITPFVLGAVGLMMVGTIWIIPIYFPSLLAWPHFSTARGLIFAIFFTNLGGWLASMPAAPTRTALALCLTGGLLLIGEALLLARFLPAHLIRIDEALALLPFSLGAFWLSIARTQPLPRPLRVLTTRYTLGIYLLHPAILLFVTKLPFMTSAAGSFILPILTYVLTLGACVALNRFALTRRFIR